MSDTYVVVWSGTLHRQDEARYSLLGSGWQIRETELQRRAPEKAAYPTQREIAAANLIPADDMFRQYPSTGRVA